MDYVAWLDLLAVNVIAPHRMVSALLRESRSRGVSQFEGGARQGDAGALQRSFGATASWRVQCTLAGRGPAQGGPLHYTAGMASAKSRSYDDEEVRAILDRALRSPDGGAAGTELSHEQLIELGAEIGLSPQRIERAAQDVAQSKATTALEQRIISRRRRWLGHHLSLFLGVNGLLFLINFLTTPGQWWFLFPFVATLIPLALHARFGLSKHISERARRREAARAREASAQDALPSAARVRIAPGDDASSREAAENVNAVEADDAVDAEARRRAQRG